MRWTRLTTVVTAAALALTAGACLGEFDPGGSTYYECETNQDCEAGWQCEPVTGASVSVCVAPGEVPPSVEGGDISAPEDVLAEVLDDVSVPEDGIGSDGSTGPHDVPIDPVDDASTEDTSATEDVATVEDSVVPPDGAGDIVEDVATPDAVVIPDVSDAVLGTDADEDGGAPEEIVDSTCTTDSDCPDGLTCQAADASATAFACMEPNQWLCQPCQSDAACADGIGFGGKCQNQGAVGSFCVVACAQGGDDCPANFECANDGSGWWCEPQAGACSCNAFGTLLALQTSCFESNGSGLCGGSRACGAGGLSACDAPTPEDEACNGVDDDCDGSTDEATALWCAEQEGDPCTVDDSCVEGSCVAGTAVTCDPHPDEPCVVNTCAPAGIGNALDFTCTPSPAADGVACADGDDCTQTDVCDGAGVCGGEPIQGCCETAADCTDDPCLEVSCEAGACVETPLSDVACDDSDPCTQGETCAAGVCQGGEAVVCPAGSQCQTVACDPAALTGDQCVYSAKTGEACDDGDPCTTGDACDDAAACVPGGALTAPACCHSDVECDDDNVCTADTCGEGDACVFSDADGVSCDDGDPCTLEDACLGGGCAENTPFPCSPGDDCNVVECVVSDAEEAECVLTVLNNTVCDDGDPCTILDTCLEGVCSPAGNTPACCTSDDDPACDDGDPCTDETCDLDINSCVHTPNTGGPCDADGDGCTVADTCVSGLCTEGPTAECAVQPCHVAVCLSGGPDSFDCDYQVTPEEPCDDGNPCTVAEQCGTDGACIPGPLLPPQTCCLSDADCDDDNPCTADSCLDTVCEHPPQSIACNADDTGCTADDFCDAAGECVVGATVECPEPEACQLSVCAPDDTDVNAFVCETLSAPAGDPCEAEDTCFIGGCSDGECVPAVARYWAEEYAAVGDAAGAAVAVRADGSVLVAGYSEEGPAAGLEGRHMLFNPLGAPEWNRTIGTPDADEAFAGAAALPDGGFMLAGREAEIVDRVWVTRIDANGDDVFPWPVTFGNGVNAERVNSVVLDSSEETVFAVGSLAFTPAGLHRACVRRLDVVDGSFPLWTKVLGGAGDDRLASGAVVGDDLFTVGSTTSSGAGGTDGWLLRLSQASGAQELALTFGGAGNDRFAAVIPHDGGIAVAGSRDVAGTTRTWVLALTTAGSVKWERAFEGSLEHHGAALTSALDGGLAVLTETGSGDGRDLVLSRLGAGGTRIWDRGYGSLGPDVAGDVAALPGGGFVITGAHAPGGDGTLEMHTFRVDDWGAPSCTEGSACDALTPADCNAGALCNQVSCAVNVGCELGAADDCDDDNECTTDSCDQDSGTCVHTNAAEDTTCSPVDGCGDASCQSGECVVASVTACHEECIGTDCSVPGGDPCKTAGCGFDGCVVERRNYHRPDMFEGRNGSAHAVLQHPTDGGHFIAGEVQGPVAGDQAFVRRLDGDGQTLWTFELGAGDTERFNGLAAVAFDPAVTPQLYGVGASGDEALVARFDDQGAVQWAITLDEGTELLDVTHALVPDGPAVVAAGYKDGSSGESWWVVALDDNGGIEWQLSDDSTGDDRIRGVGSVDFTGGFVVTGTFNDQLRIREITELGSWAASGVDEGPGGGNAVTLSFGPGPPGVAIAGWRVNGSSDTVSVLLGYTMSTSGPFAPLDKQWELEDTAITDAGFEGVVGTPADAGLVAVANSGGVATFHKFDGNGYRMWQRGSGLASPGHRVTALGRGLGNGIAAVGEHIGTPWALRLTRWGHDDCGSGDPCAKKDEESCGPPYTCQTIDCVRASGEVTGCKNGPVDDPGPLPLWSDGTGGPCEL